MEKNSKTSTRKTSAANIVSQLYPEMYNLKQRPLPDEIIVKLACDYLMWARTDKDALCVSQFPIKKNLCIRTWRRWCKTRETLKIAHAEVLVILGVNREVGMLKGTLKEKPVMLTMHQYSADWEKSDQRWAKIRQDSQLQNKTETQVIIIDPLTPQDTKQIADHHKKEKVTEAISVHGKA